MGFGALFEASSIPVLQVLIISVLGAFLATEYCNLLTADARKHLNKIVFVVFTPCLVFASLVQSVTLEDIISWWFMPVNIGLTYLIGGSLGWMAAKLLKPEPHLESVIIAFCSAGNLGNLMIIIIPAVCNEEGTPFGISSVCTAAGLAYSSFSMALGAFYIWTHTYHMMRTAGELYYSHKSQEEITKIPNGDLEAGAETQLLKASQEDKSETEMSAGSYAVTAAEAQPKNTEANPVTNRPVLNKSESNGRRQYSWQKWKAFLHRIVDELLAPPTVAVIVGLVAGSIPSVKSLILKNDSPLRVLLQSVSLLGNGTIPSITLILGGNLTEGLRSGKTKPRVTVAILLVRYLILPICGIAVVRLADVVGLLPPDPLYRYVLMVQFTLPPAMAIGTMAQLFNVAEQECSVIFLATYLVAAIALTVWSTFYMWILS